MALEGDAPISFGDVIKLALRLLKRRRSELNPVERTIVLAYVYVSEIWNGGHGQFLDNQGLLRGHATVSALNTIGASEMARVLKALLPAYLRRLKSPTGARAKTVGEFQVGRYKVRLDRADKSFDQSSPGVDALLCRYVDRKHSS